jgi:hypothetical protein
MAAGRNSIGYEIEPAFRDAIIPPAAGQMELIIRMSNHRIHERIRSHLDFVQKRSQAKGECKHRNKHYRFPVVTSQEVELFFNPLESIQPTAADTLEVTYADLPAEGSSGHEEQLLAPQPNGSARQLRLF